MRKIKLIIATRQIWILLLLVSTLIVASCKEEEEPAPEPGIVNGDVPEFAVVDVPVTFIDKSLSVASREWTVTGGTPATSTDKSIEVSFTQSGTQTVTLKIDFENGTEATETFSVTVADALNAKIAAEGGDASFEFGDTDISFTFSFSITEEVGDPDSYNWSFPTGTPSTSTEANPTVTFSGENPEVILTLMRSTDGASLEITETFDTQGPDNLWTNDYWGFESTEVVGWLQTWDGDNAGPWADGVISQIDDGYEGKGIQVNYPGNTGYYGVISRDWYDHNTQLNSGDIVLFSYYAKVASEGSPVGFSRVVNHIPSWSVEDPAQAQNYQFFNNMEPVDNIGTEWTRITHIDTLSNLEQATAGNVFPEFGFSGDPAVISLDKVELRLLGNVND